MHKDRMTANILPPVLRQPTTDRHDSIGGETARSEVSSTARADGLAGRVIREKVDEFLQEPSPGGN